MVDQPYQILVVDDEPDLEVLVRQRMRREIREGKYHFTFAANGIEALSKLEDNPAIDVVLTDINMPQMDGLTLLDQLPNKDNKLRSVVISAYGDIQNIRTAMNRGAFDFIVKPVDFGDLRITVERTMNNLHEWRAAFAAQAQLVALQNELQIAKQMQQSILSTDFPKESTHSLHASMVAAKEVGGDFYDFYQLPDGRLGIAIADVSGKGVPAALFMMIGRTLLKSAAQHLLSPAEVLAEVNGMLQGDNPNMMFVTVLYAIFDPISQVLTYANGGHNPMLHVQTDGSSQALGPSDGIALGVMEGYKYSNHEVQLHDGELIVMYTDGVTEAENSNSEQFEMKRFQAVFADTTFADPRAANEAVSQGVADFVGDYTQSDDITCLTLRVGRS